MDKVKVEMELIELLKTSNDNTYADIIEKMDMYNQKLKEFYNDLAMMRFDVARVKLEFLKAQNVLNGNLMDRTLLENLKSGSFQDFS